MKDEKILATDLLKAEELIRYIANDPPELSHDKIIWQRDDFIKICKRWINHNENKD